MIRRPIVVPGLVVLFGVMAGGQPPGPFVAPRDRSAWEARREAIRRDLEQAASLGRPPRPEQPRFDVRGRETKPGVVVERVALESGEPAAGTVLGFLVVPEGAGLKDRVPLILLVGGPAAPGSEVAALGHLRCASLSLETGPDVRLWRVALDAARARPEFDPARVGVIGLGAGGPTALRLMALDDRIACGAVHLDPAPLVPESGRLEESAALCAPRPLALLIAEPFPVPAGSPGRRLERAVKPTYKLYGPAGTGLTFNLYGRSPGLDSGVDLLRWLAGLEQLDKHLRPQGPEPLAHAPEPEPEPEGDARFVDLAEHGLAGWSAEMTDRPGTWSWADGVISCKPGPGEFGWLRAPVEVGDFVLRVEWRVPEKGNGGIFLRARPVPWKLPTADRAKPLLQSLGLEWPSRTGLELQAQADPGEANRYSSGSLYRHAAPAANPTRPPGQWNRYTVRARGLRVEVWSNGQQILDTSLDRYPSTLPRPPLRGYVGLQNHGSPGEYRNVKLLNLGDPRP